MTDKIYASFKSECWDLDAYRYSVRKEYVLSKLVFNLLIITLVLVYSIIDFIKGDYTNGLIALVLVLAYIGTFIYLYFRNSNRFVNELENNIKYVEVDFYHDHLSLKQKSKTNTVKTNFEYKEILRLTGKDKYFFVKFKEITLPFNKESLVYNESNFDEIISNMVYYINLEKENKNKKSSK